MRPTCAAAPNGANLLRSGIALADQHGELVGAAVARHTRR